MIAAPRSPAGRPHRSRRPNLATDRSGATMVEFALVFPVFILAILGVIEIALIIFISSSIESALIRASRSATICSAPEAVSRQERILEIIAEQTYGLVDMDDLALETRVYADFADIGAEEPFRDADGDGAYSAGEPFTDINGNGGRDADLGAAGLGGANDIVLYRVSYTWGLLTPLVQVVMGEGFRYASSVAMRNEPC